MTPDRMFQVQLCATDYSALLDRDHVWGPVVRVTKLQSFQKTVVYRLLFWASVIIAIANVPFEINVLGVLNLVTLPILLCELCEYDRAMSWAVLRGFDFAFIMLQNVIYCGARLGSVNFRAGAGTEVVPVVAKTATTFLAIALVASLDGAPFYSAAARRILLVLGIIMLGLGILDVSFFHFGSGANTEAMKTPVCFATDVCFTPSAIIISTSYTIIIFFLKQLIANLRGRLSNATLAVKIIHTGELQVVGE